MRIIHWTDKNGKRRKREFLGKSEKGYFLLHPFEGSDLLLWKDVHNVRIEERKK